MPEAVFLVSAVLILSGAVGVVASRNPVHSALFLVQTLVAVALLFILQDAHFLAAVQIIVYAGAIVILFLFVIMLLGVDRAEQLRVESIFGQRPLALVCGAGLAAILVTLAVIGADALTGAISQDSERRLDGEFTDIEQLGRLLFSDYAFAVEITAVLLTIAVVGAVVLTRRRGSPASASDSPASRSADGGSA